MSPESMLFCAWLIMSFRELEGEAGAGLDTVADVAVGREGAA